MTVDSDRFDARLDVVPTSPGVYLMKDASGSVIYVGKAKHLRNRLRSYFGKNPTGSGKVLAMISHIADFEYIEVQNELESFLLESNLIKNYQPHYNILLRDDKGYPYVCVTMHEPYPRVFRAFRIGPDRKKGAKYYGPFLAGDLYFAIRTLRDIFPIKTCHRIFPRDIGKERPCLNYHIGKCIGPCKGDVSVEEYRGVMQDICLFFEGRYNGIQRDLQRKMTGAAEREEYETAALYRDRLLSLEKIMESQKVEIAGLGDMDVIGMRRDTGEICIRKLELRGGRITGSPTFFLTDNQEEDAEVIAAFLEQHYGEESEIPKELLLSHEVGEKDDLEIFLSSVAGHKVSLRIPKRGDGVRLLQLATDNARSALLRRVLKVGDSESALTAAIALLQTYTGVEGSLGRVEAYDISNLGDDDRCGAMVVFREGKPEKSGYRHFKIKRTEGQNDFEAMREVLERRFSSKNKETELLPDLILIDGGQGHLTVAGEVLEKTGLDSRIRAACMVKNNKHKTRGLALPDGRIIELLDESSSSSEAMVLLRLLTAIQNEVHRFALAYQRKLSEKRHLSFKLESIEGIGTAKRKKLLLHFGTIGKIRAASEDDLRNAPSISEKDARSIYRYFHRDEEEG